MGDNQLSILIQAKIDEASTKTMQDQLTQLAKNLKSVKISLDLGDVKAQFAKMFQEIEKESQKQSARASGMKSKAGNQVFTGSDEEAIRKMTSHMQGFDKQVDSVYRKIKEMGNIKSFTEVFDSKNGDLQKFRVEVENVVDGLQKVKTIDVFKRLADDGKDVVFEMNEVKVKTKEVGYAMESLATAGNKGNDKAPYERLYQALQQFVEGGQNATKVANELHDAIYNSKTGEEKAFFKRLDASTQEQYLKALQEARAKEAEMDEIHYQALQMNKKHDNAIMDALHKEALEMNKKYDKEQERLAKEAEALEKAHTDRLIQQENERIKQEEALAKKRLEQRKADMMEAIRLQEEEEKALKNEQAKASKQANIDLFRNSMNKSLDDLTFNHSVDGAKVQALRTALKQLSVETVDVSTKMKQMKAEFQGIKDSSIQITTATSNMGLLEQEIINVSEKLNTNKISLQEYADIMKSLMYDGNGNLTKAFDDNISIQNKTKYINQYETALNRIAQAQQRNEKNEERQNLLAQQKSTFYTQIEAQLKKIESTVKNISNYDDVQYQNIVNGYNELRASVEAGNTPLTEARARFSQLGTELRNFQQDVREANATSGNFLNTLKMFVGIYSLYDVFELGKRAIKSMVNEVKVLDASLVEMNKVAGLSDDALDNFVSRAYEVADVVGRLGSDVVDATGDFVKMGESVEDALKLAENALVYVNVGDGVDVNDATKTMISAMKAFNIQADGSMDIIDKMNNMANNFAITTAGLGSGLQIASSALASANNSIDETLALMSVGNLVTQNPDVVANGLKTISMRLRGLADDEGELVSNMEEIFDTYAKGIKIINDDGSFKSTFEILNELGGVWDTLTDKKQAYLAEKIAGKHRANIFLAIMENADELEKALETSMNSANSAMMENEAFMDSIEGKTQQLKSAWQELATSFISSDMVKGLIDSLTAFVKFATDVDLLKIAVIGLTGALVALCAVKVQAFMGTIISTVPKVISHFKNVGIAVSMAHGVFNKLSTAMLALNLNPVVLGITAVTAVVAGFAVASNNAKRRAEELAEASRELAQAGQEAVDSISDITQRYNDLYDPVTQTITNKEQLAEIQRELVNTFGEEANGIDLVNGKYDETLGKLNELTEAKLKQNEVFLRENFDVAEQDAINAINDGGKRFSVQFSGSEDEMVRVISQMKKEFDDVFETFEFEGEMSFRMNTDDIERAEEAWTALITKMQDEGVDRSNKTYQEAFEVLRNVTNASEALSTAQQELYDNLSQQTVKQAMASAGCVDLKNATEQQVTAIKEFMNEVVAINPVLANYTQKLLEASNPDFSNFTKADAEALNILNTALSETEKAMTSLKADIELLDGAITTLTNDQMLSGETINTLINTYGELQDALILTDKGYTISRDALLALRQAKVDEANTTAETQRNNVTNVINGAKERLKAYKAEMSAIKSLAQAQQALARTKLEHAQTESKINNIVEKRMDELELGGYAKYKQTPAERFKENYELKQLQEQKETQESVIEELETVVEGYEYIEEMDKRMQAMEIEATNSYYQATTPSSSSANKKKESEKKADKKSYIAQELDVLIDDILSSSDKLEEAIEFANEKVVTAQLKGDIKTEKALKSELTSLIKQRRDETVKQAENLRAEGQKMIKVLSGTGLFKDVNLETLTEKQLSDVSKQLEKRIANATDEQANDLELLKAKVEEYGNAIIRIYKDELPELSREWWELTNQHIEQLQEAIEDTYNLSKKRIDASTRDIEIQQILLEESSEQYIALEKEKYKNVLALQEEARQALKKIKEIDKNLESEMAQEYLDIWYDAEKEKREMIKSFAEQAMEAREEEIDKLMDSYEEAQDALNTILEKTIELIKQEKEEKKEALEEELDLYKELIDKKKENLKADKEARDDAKNLKKKQDAVSKLEAQIAELQFDTSASGVAKRLELEEQLAEAREELEDFQYEQSIEKQEEALDEEYERFKELIDKQIKDIEDYLSKEGNLRKDALDMIENNSAELYEKLLVWNDEYGTGVRSDITNAWEIATEAMTLYNDGQMNVLDTLEKIIQATKELEFEKENLKVEDFYDTAEGGMMGDIQSNPDSPSVNHGNVISEEEAKKKERLNQQKYLHEQAKKAKAENNTGLLKWVQEQRKIWKFDPNSGADLKGYETYVPSDHWEKAKSKYNIYHTGGFVGDLESNEEFAKLLKGEYVATEQQMKSFMEKTLPSIAGVSTGSQELNFENLISLQVNGNLDNSVLPELESVIKTAVDSAIGKINSTLSSKGFRRTAMSLGI